MSDQTLQEQTAAYSESLKGRAPADLVAAFDATARSLGRRDFGERIKVGDRAPSFTLPNARGGEFALDQALISSIVALTFYRGSWCAYCNLQLRAYANVIAELESCGGRLVAVSPMTETNSAEFAANAGFPFDVLADSKAAVAEAYGVAFELEGDARATYESAGIDLVQHNGDEPWRLPAPALFIIDGGGVVRFAHSDGDWRNRVEPADLVAAVRRVASSDGSVQQI